MWWNKSKKYKKQIDNLKEENKKLKKEIDTLIFGKWEEKTNIEVKYRIMRDMEKSIWFSNPISKEDMRKSN